MFQRVFLTQVEPVLPRDRAVFITRHPAAIPTLARTIPGTPWADRWELYLNGVETANCFGEETDPARIRAFFTAEREKKRRHGRYVHPTDPSFLQPPETLPECSGVALGVDRLVAARLGRSDIGQVISFPLSDIVASHELQTED
jgi:lysyl-tRNA synthetase class 2